MLQLNFFFFPPAWCALIRNTRSNSPISLTERSTANTAAYEHLLVFLGPKNRRQVLRHAEDRQSHALLQRRKVDFSKFYGRGSTECFTEFYLLHVPGSRFQVWEWSKLHLQSHVPDHGRTLFAPCSSWVGPSSSIPVCLIVISSTPVSSNLVSSTM